MKTNADLMEWCEGVAAQFGDPSAAVGQTFVRFQKIVTAGARDDRLVATFDDNRLTLSMLGTALPLLIDTTGPQFAQSVVNDPRGIAGICSECGCTQDDPCDPPCSWANDARTVCSTCAQVLAAFGIIEIVPGLWHLTPSLNLPGVLHMFVVVYDVPSPAPWERRIITDVSPRDVSRFALQAYEAIRLAREIAAGSR
jgi:hypothetical protein